MKRRLRALALCMAVLFASAALLPAGGPTTAQARTMKEVERDISECQALLKTLQNEVSGIRAELEKLSGNSSRTEEGIQKKLEEIDALEAEIEATKAMRASFDARIGEQMAQLILAEDERDAYTERFCEQLRFIYENGDTNAFELLFNSADGLSDYLSKLDNFNAIMEYTENVVAGLERSIRDIETLSGELKDTQQVYDAYLTELRAKEEERNQAVEQLKIVSAGLGQDYEKLRASYTGKNQTLAEVKEKLEILRKERAALEEALKNEQNTNPDYKPDPNAVYQWPLPQKAPGSFRFTSFFGKRKDPEGSGKIETHKGQDIASPRGTPIYASRGGTVTLSKYYGTFGKVVFVYHGDGVTTIYAHCDVLIAKEGDIVKAGDLIGKVGATGRAFGYHLHYGVKVNGEYVNPLDYMPKNYADEAKRQKAEKGK